MPTESQVNSLHSGKRFKELGVGFGLYSWKPQGNNYVIASTPQNPGANVYPAFTVAELEAKGVAAPWALISQQIGDEYMCYAPTSPHYPETRSASEVEAWAIMIIDLIEHGHLSANG